MAVCVAPGFAPVATSPVPPWPRRRNEKSPLESGGERPGGLFSIATGVASPSCPRLHPLARKTWASGFRAFGLASIAASCDATSPFSRWRSKAKGLVASPSAPATEGRAAPPNHRACAWAHSGRRAAWAMKRPTPCQRGRSLGSPQLVRLLPAAKGAHKGADGARPPAAAGSPKHVIADSTLSAEPRVWRSSTTATPTKPKCYGSVLRQSAQA